MLLLCLWFGFNSSFTQYTTFLRFLVCEGCVDQMYLGIPNSAISRNTAQHYICGTFGWHTPGELINPRVQFFSKSSMRQHLSHSLTAAAMDLGIDSSVETPPVLPRPKVSLTLYGSFPVWEILNLATLYFSKEHIY